MAVLISVSGKLAKCGGNPFWGVRSLALLALLFTAIRAPGAETPAAQEYRIKAVYLFNFAQFVEWPASTFPQPESPLVIGVLGRDPFNGSLQEAVRGETANGRPLAIEHYSRIEDVSYCQILFIGQSESSRLPAIMEALKGRSILTVSDAEGFTQQGGMIGLVTEQNKVRFRINLESAKAANLTLSSKLLRPATIVTPSLR